MRRRSTLTRWLFSPMNSSTIQIRTAKPGKVRGLPLLIGAASLACGVLLWWLLAASGGLPEYILPGPGQVASRAVDLWQSGMLSIHVQETLAAVLQGVLIGSIVGVVLAVLFYRVRWIERLLMPLIVVMQVTPKISIAPLIILWLGLGIGSKIALVILVTFYPVMINMVGKLRGMPTPLNDLSRILNIRGVRRAWQFELPYCLPAIAAGLRVGVLQAVTAAVIGEFIGATAGLGYLESQAQNNDDIEIVLIAIILLSLMGWALYALVGLMERKISSRFGG